MNLREFLEAGKVSLVAKSSNGESVLLQYGDKETTLNKEVMKEHNVDRTYTFATCRENERDIVKELFTGLEEVGIKARVIRYYTSRNYSRPKGEYRRRDYLD